VTESTPASILDGLTLEVVEWLPSGAEGGLVRVRGRWGPGVSPLEGLPVLCVSVGGGEASRFESLPDAPSSRLGNGGVWRGAYLVPESLVRDGALWLEWSSGEQSAVPPVAGLDARAAVSVVVEPEEDSPGGEVIDRAVLAERRARRAEAAEQAQARVASEALRALDAVELRGSELEARVEALAAERDSLAAQVSEIERRIPRDEHARAALSDALAAAAAARRHAGDLQLRMRAAEVARTSDAVRLRVLEASESSSVSLREERAAYEADLAAARERASVLEAEAGRAREQSLAAAADLDDARRDFSRRLAESGAAASEAQTALERARSALAEREGELAAATAELEAVRAELTEVRSSAEADLTQAEARATDLAAALEAERVARAAAGAEAETARSEAASATASLAAERVARASLEAELDRERAARSALSDALDAETAALASLHVDLNAERASAADLRAEAEAERASAAALRAELDAERGVAAELRSRLDSAADLEQELARERAARQADQSALAALRDDLAAERAALAEVREQLEALRAEVEAAPSRDDLAAELRAELESAREADRAVLAALRADLDAERSAREADQAELAELRSRLAASEEGGLLDRVAELDRRAAGLADELELQRRAREQAEAAAAAPGTSPEESSRVVADLDAAASALRERAENGTTIEVDVPPAEAVPVEVEVAPDTAEAAAAPVSPEAPDEALAPAATPPEKRPIVSAPAGPSRAHATGRSQRQYPWLRGALVKLAHDDPQAAGKVIAGLLPVQAAIVQGPVDYDITIAEVGTFAVTVAGGRAYVKDLEQPRGRREAEFHLSADPLTLAELIAGVPHKIGRFRGAARVSGRKRRLKPLKAIPAATLSLAEAARAGARLEPALIFRTFPYVIHAAWSRDHSFTVAQRITSDPPATWYVTVGHGGVRILTAPPEDGADATVTMTPEGFSHLLRGEPTPPGHRPIVRGDREVVALLKSWLDRAQAA
jgi:hypothetical protein